MIERDRSWLEKGTSLFYEHRHFSLAYTAGYKVVACLLQRLAVCLTYLTALCSFQRTVERRNFPFRIYRVGSEGKRNRFFDFLLFPPLVRMKYLDLAVQVIFPYTISTNGTVHFGKNRFIFFFPHHIRTGKTDLLQKYITFFHTI